VLLPQDKVTYHVILQLQWVILGEFIHAPKLGRLISESEIKPAQTQRFTWKP